MDLKPAFKSADMKWFPPVRGNEKVIICNDVSLNENCREVVSLLEKITDCYGDDQVEIKNGQLPIFWDFFIVTSNYSPIEVAAHFHRDTDVLNRRFLILMNVQEVMFGDALDTLTI